MVQNDIYNSQKSWETVEEKIKNGEYARKPKAGSITTYYVKNPKNLQYFRKLIAEFKTSDISFMRRIQYIKALRKTCYATTKDLKDLTLDDAKKIVAYYNDVNKTMTTRRDFVNFNKYIWKLLFPELDVKGRPDPLVTPHAWRITVKQDKSLQKDKTDKFTDTDYSRIQKGLSKDPRMQLYFSMIYHQLARPQELCYINLENIELFDNYARIRISEHGKEGTKTLQVVDNYYYLSQWLNKHPYWPNDKKKPLFILTGNHAKYDRLTPKYANMVLKTVLREIKLDKPITAYSFKRNGVTARVLAGEPAQNIQKTAGWTSTQQLKTYDLSDQEEFLEQELVDRGIKKPGKDNKKKLMYRQCFFCNVISPAGATICDNCKRPLDREQILKAEEEKDARIQRLENQMKKIQEYMVIKHTERARKKGLEF